MYFYSASVCIHFQVFQYHNYWVMLELKLDPRVYFSESQQKDDYMISISDKSWIQIDQHLINTMLAIEKYLTNF